MPEQAVRKVRQGERLLNEGQELAEVLRHLEITEATFSRWRSQYGGMKADEAKRLKSLEVENQVVRELDLHRSLHQPLRQLRQQTTRPDDLLLPPCAGEQLVGHPLREKLPHPLR